MNEYGEEVDDPCAGQLIDRFSDVALNGLGSEDAAEFRCESCDLVGPVQLYCHFDSSTRPFGGYVMAVAYIDKHRMNRLTCI